MNRVEVLRRSDVFHYLDEDDLKTVEKMATEETFEPGAIIFRQSEDADNICLRVRAGFPYYRAKPQR